MSEEPSELDEELYSRQLYVLGAAAQLRLQQSRVIVSGALGGLGAELCKNVVLAGVSALHVHDAGACCAWTDLASAGFFFGETEVMGKMKRAEALVRELAELNSHVALMVAQEDVCFAEYDVVVLVNATKQRISQISSEVRKSDEKKTNTRLIVTGAYGLFSYVFSDFTDSWDVFDMDGEVIKSGLVLNATVLDNNNNNGHHNNNNDDDGNGNLSNNNGKGSSLLKEFEIQTEHAHRLNDGDFVRFSFDQEEKPKRIQLVFTDQGRLDECKFKIHGKEEALEFDGSYFEQVKVTTTITSHKPFDESMENPSFVNNSFDDESRPTRLFALLEAIWAFEASNERLPNPSTVQDMEWILHVVERKVVLSDSQRTNMRKLITTLQGQLSPIAAFIGGVAGQEVLKACTGKFTPLDQWLMFSAEDGMPIPNKAGDWDDEDIGKVALSEKGGGKGYTRYLGQTNVFGDMAQEKLGSLKVFVIGAGALGCELMKHLALMGCCTLEGGGIVHVTDPDSIELSNLNRQFLFRPNSVGKNKAKCVAEAAKKMNPFMNIKAYEEKVYAGNETFSHSFWESLDIVINALDNVPSRLFVDSQCVLHKKPLLESGTLGTKANTLPVIPNITESYGSDQVRDYDANEEIPACTLHAYPNLFEHCLQWARDAVFEKEFVIDPSEARAYWDASEKNQLNEYIEQLKKQPNSMYQKLQAARSVLWGILPDDHPEGLFPYKVNTSFSSMTFQDCIMLARLKFQEYFSNKIDLLLLQHPADAKDGDGIPFWSQKRRCPTPMEFDQNFSSSNKNNNHGLFVLSYAKLIAKTHGIQYKEEELNLDHLQNHTQSIPKFQATNPSLEEEDDNNHNGIGKKEKVFSNNIEENSDWKLLKALREGISSSKGGLISIESNEFNKDDDLHIDLIWSAASIRAANYRIPIMNRMEAKRVVGRIIPAIATTTAAATGLVSLELYKIALNSPELYDVSMFRASNFNLAVNSFTGFEPRACASTGKFGNLDCNLWTCISMKGDLTVEEFVDQFEENYGGFLVSSISTSGELSLFNDLFSDDVVRASKISELYQNVVGEALPQNDHLTLIVDGDFEEEGLDDFVAPPVRLYWNSSSSSSS